jgi:hypothetical protein
MNARLLLILTVIVCAIGAAAYYFGQERKSLQTAVFEPGPLVAGIENQINDVDEARLESQEGGILTLTRKDGQWAIAEHYGYRANPERVNQLLKTVATLKKIEPKTKKQENHKRLNLGDPAGELSLATRITLKAGDVPVADMVVGLNRPPAHGGGAYVRLWGEDQTWLTEGEFKPKRRLIDLLDRNVVNVDGRRMRSGLIEHPAPKPAPEGTIAETVLISKETPDQKAYSLGADIPEGGKPKPDHELSSVIRLPDFLIFEDVKPASELESDISPIVSTFETFDGLRFVFRTHKAADGALWSTIKVDTAEVWPGLATFVEANKGKDTENGRITNQMKTAEEQLTAEIAKWTKQTATWAFKLTGYKSKRLTVDTAEMLEKPEPAKAPK